MSVIESKAAPQDQLVIDAAFIEKELQQNGPNTVSYIQWKGLLDRGMAALMLLPALPVIGVLVVLVRISSKGPGIFSQIRVGENGKNFTMYKLRTMGQDAETGSGPAWSQGMKDPRITFIGRILRRLYLDELPQLFNVLGGEMSLIGPRPERPEFVQVLAQQIPGYLDRLAVKPGITGLAQINLPADSDVDSVKRKLILDLEYIEQANFLLDLRMIFCTALRFFGIRGALAMRLMKLSREAKLADDSGTKSNTDEGVVSLSAALSANDAPPSSQDSNGNGKIRHDDSSTVPKPRQGKVKAK